jgi:hypothetical protein
MAQRCAHDLALKSSLGRYPSRPDEIDPQNARAAAATSGNSAVFLGFRPASLSTATTRDRGRLSLIATICQEVLRVNGQSHARPLWWRVRMQPARVAPTPKRAGRLFDASVDQSDARKQVRNRDKPSRHAKVKVVTDHSS